MFLEKPDIFVTQLILYVQRINYYMVTKIIMLRTQIIVILSSTPFLFRRKWVYVNGKLTKLH